MSTLTVNGSVINGDALVTLPVYWAIVAIQKAGDIRQLVFNGSTGTVFLNVNASTQAQILIEPSEEHILDDLAGESNVRNVLEEYGVVPPRNQNAE